MRHCFAMLILALCASSALAQASPPVHLWFEPEWFDGVKGSFGYWTGSAKPTGAWGVAGPGIAAEWSQGGESEWNSMGTAAEETSARCQRDFAVPRAGTYKVWVRFYEPRKKTSPFRIVLEQPIGAPQTHEFGVKPVLPANDEYQLFWGFSFAWDCFEVKLAEGPAKVAVVIDKAGQAWRQVDAILITDDLKHVPLGREKPAFAYHAAFGIRPTDGASWRGSKRDFAPTPRKAVAGRDFSMWTGIDADVKWWSKQDVDKLSKYDAFFQFSPPSDIRDKFHKQFAGRKDVPIMSWPGLLPGFYLGNSPDLSEGSPIRRWLERTKMPFYIMTNYASGKYDDKTGPATYAALTGPLAEQFLGYIHGEAIGTVGISLPGPGNAVPGLSRREYVDGVPKHWREKQADAWTKIYKTKIAPEHWERGISCLSVDSIALAHLFHESGARIVGYEIDATNVHAPMRIAFERGAARQYGNAWINYASGNFGDACNYFTQNPVVPRGAPAWYHSRYTITDGVSISWYRKLYYLNYLGGASAIYWEQNLTNQYLLPGPGTHPIQLSPFGRATEDFQAFVDRVPDRGEPYTPIGILLSYAHGYERVNYRCKMLHDFPENIHDRELRELFNVCWHPTSVLEGQPASPDVQSMPSGVFGDIFDVIVDRATKPKAMHQYPVVWAAGEVKLAGDMLPIVEAFVKNGGALVTTITQAKDLPIVLTGLKANGKSQRAEEWSLDGVATMKATPFEVAQVELQGAKPLAFAGKSPLMTRHAVGQGAVIVILVPHGLGIDERAHPCLPVLMNALTEDLLPFDVRLADGRHPTGEVMYQVNRTKDGWLLSFFNQRGIDKTQNGIARVDRRQFVDVSVRTKLVIASAREMTEPRDLALGKDGTLALRIPAGDLQVVHLRTK